MSSLPILIALSIDDVDMIDDYVVNSIIYNNCNSNNKVRDCTFAPNTNSFCSILCSFSNKSEELYMDQM